VSFAYLGMLLFSLIGLTLIDYKFKLAFFGKAKRAALAMSIPFALFVIWDLAGIAAGIFFRGHAEHLLGVNLFPEFPIEELFFLAVLCYTTLLLTARLARTK
jgi:lycopene cyclase domain-containing protein